LKVNFYSGNRGAQGLSIIFPPSFMLFVCFCMCDIMWSYKHSLFVFTLPFFTYIKLRQHQTCRKNMKLQNKIYLYKSGLILLKSNDHK
jgi:hypothetical protein